ncbi:GerAB/ArcD/ProY family transporter [Paenibacillus chungangensis]|uniref:Endospore germination permease n=1 Tax=Paenibacillus chungangensis TaxID=696535 RepID=A0ABW3HLS2_9BACL
MEATFSNKQITFLLLLSLGISNHVIVIPHLLQAAGRDAWMSILVTYVFLIAWSLLLHKVIKSMKHTSMIPWLRSRAGRAGYWMIGGTMACYFLLMGLIIVYDTTKNVSIYFLPNTPIEVTVVCFVLVAYSAARTGLKTIVFVAAVTLPIVWILGVAVSLMTKGSKDYGLLLPLFTDGYMPYLYGGVVIFGGSIDLIALLMLQHRMEKPIKYGTIFVILSLLVGLILGPCMGSLAAFGPAAASNLRFPAFEQWRLVIIGRYINHVDFLAAFQLMAGSLVRAALCIHVWSELIGNQLSAKTRQFVIIGGTLLMALPSLLKPSDIMFQSIMQRYYYKLSLLYGVLFVAVLYGLTYIRPKKEGVEK